MANKALTNLGLLQYKSEGAAANFATDPGGPYTYLPVIGTPDFGPAIRRAWDDETLRQTMVALPKLMGASGMTECEFTFSFYLRGFTGTIPTAAPTQHFCATLIAAALGNVAASTDTPTLALSGATATVIPCTDASLDADNNTFAGGFMGFEAGAAASGVYDGRFCTDIDETEVTPSDEVSILPLGDANVGLTTAPGVGADVYTGVTAYHIDTYDSTNAPSYTFVWEGHTTEDQMKLLGCRPTRMVITLNTAEHARVEMTWRAVGLTSGDNSGISAQAVTTPVPEVIADAPRYFLTDGTNNLSPLLAKTCTITYECNNILEDDATATYGYANQTKGNATVTAEIDPLFDADGDQIETWYEAQTGVYFELSWGTQPGKLIGVRIPYAYISTGSYRGDREGLITKPTTLVAGDYQTESGDDDVHTDGGGDVAPADANCISKIFSVGFA